MSFHKSVGAVLLIAGTCVGAGMLALPVSTAQYGAFPASVLFFICWVFLTYSAFLILEANLWLKEDSNLVSMAKNSLGTPGQVVAWVTYLLLLYSLMAAYLSGMNAIIDHSAANLFHFDAPDWLASGLLILFFGFILYLGAKPIDIINRIFMIGLVAAFCLLIAVATPHIEAENFKMNDFSGLYKAIPIALTSFGFHIIIPSLRTYLHSNTKKLTWAIFIGSTIPLIVYLIWEWVIIGAIPTEGENGLLEILASGQPAVGLSVSLDLILAKTWASTAGQFFIFFAISTSFIGVSFSLFDFLSDGFHIKKTKLGRLAIAAITFAPPLVLTLVYPHLFILALNYAGLFVAVLLGLLPILMVLRGRYTKNIHAPFRVPGGKPALCVALIFFITVMFIELI